MRSTRGIRPPAIVRALGLGLLAAAALCVSGCTKGPGSANSPATAAQEPGTVRLKDSQLGAVKLGTVGTQVFEQRSTAVGAIDFDENAAVQVFSPYAGRILQAFADLGDASGAGNGDLVKAVASVDDQGAAQSQHAERFRKFLYQIG